VHYPPRLRLATLPTPFEPLDRFSAELGGPRIWVKRDDLSHCPASGNKIRKLEFTLARALELGCDTVVTCGGLQSNHCRATAVLGARLGLRVRLLLRGLPQDAPPDGNLYLDTLCGAHIDCRPNEQVAGREIECMEEICEQERAAGHRPLLIPVGASDGTGVWGYLAACDELREDFARHGIRPGAIVVATGSGGTQAGLTAGVALHGLGAEVWGMAVCADADWFRAKVRQDLRDCAREYELPVDVEALPVHVLDDYIGPGYARATPEVFALIRRLARLEGLILDPVYTGKAFLGLCEQLRAGRFGAAGDDVVFIHTGGLFGLFAQRAESLQP
jgi:D-cysteine desulfhydrase